MKAAIYCRLSKEDEDKIGESESIQNQKSMLLQYAIEKGFDIYQIYSDEDYSGIDRNRPAFNSMLQAASEHQFDVVLAKTQSRFTRDMELVEKYLHGKFMEWGVRFIAVVDHVDTNDTANKKSRQINGLINEWYLEDLSTNVRSVLDHKRKEGLFIGSFARYGYCKDPNAKGKLIIDPEAAEVVRRIFSMALNGIGAHKIARILNDENSPAGRSTCLPTQKFHSIVIFCSPVSGSFGLTMTRWTSSTASSRVSCEICASSRTRCICVWTPPVSPCCCSSSVSNVSIRLSAFFTSSRKVWFISEN